MRIDAGRVTGVLWSCLAMLLVTSGSTARGPRVPIAAEPASPAAPSDELALARDLRIRVRNGCELELVLRPSTRQAWTTLARTYTSQPKSAAGALARLDGHEAAEPGRDVAIPFDLLNDDYRALVLLNQFPLDRLEGDVFVHVARAGRLVTPDEGLWQVAEWFTGDGGKFREIARADGLGSPDLSQGQVVHVPAALLHRSLLSGPSSDDGALSYGQDDGGPFAGYRLKAGEALYSAVVV